MKVLKFGGTSLGTPERMKHVESLLRQGSEARFVVLSAVSGTTNSLVAIDELLCRGEADQAKADIDNLHNTYLQFCHSLFSQTDSLQRGKEVVKNEFQVLDELADNPYETKFEKIILASGELLSTQIFSIYLDEQGSRAALIPALHFMAIDENAEPDMDAIQNKLTQIMKRYPDTGLFVTQGFICLDHSGQIDNLRRGGSDYTASIIGAVLQAEEIQIWTDIDGMHNNDPRIVPNTFPLARLSFEEAAELAYFGAKILHPSTILPAQKFQIPVHLKNTLRPEALGTIISDRTEAPGVKSIAAKDCITAIKIKSSRMLLAYGFLRMVFEIFEKYRTSIDMITTSEVAVSLTIDNRDQLDNVLGELRDLGTVFVEDDLTIICIVGDAVVDKKGIVQQIFGSLTDIPPRMISYGGSRNNISILIDTKHKEQALLSLNNNLFKEKMEPDLGPVKEHEPHQNQNG